MTDRTDRELLEAAARAAGIDYVEPAEDYDGASGFLLQPSPVPPQYRWSPLTDDGDALRLAVKLNFSVELWWGVDGKPKTIACGSVEEPYNATDPYAATRRAIVRAAAAVGEGLLPFPTAEQIHEWGGTEPKDKP